MLNRKPLAAAVAALSLACTGALAQGGKIPDTIHIESFSWGSVGAAEGHRGWIEIQSVDWRSSAGPQAPATVGGVAAPGTAEPIPLFLPAVQKVREAAARTSSERTAEERAASIGGNRSIGVGGNRSETVEAAPVAPLDEAARTAPKNATYYKPELADIIVSSYQTGGSEASKKPSATPLTPLDDVRVKGQQGPRGASHAGEQVHHAIKPENVQSANPGSPKNLSAGAPPQSRAISLKLDDIKGLTRDDLPGQTPGGAGVARPLAPLPLQAAPQRSPIADGTSNTLMLGEKFMRPATAAPAIRR